MGWLSKPTKERTAEVRKLNLRLASAAQIIRWWRKGDVTNAELKKLVKQDYLKRRLNKRERQLLGL